MRAFEVHYREQKAPTMGEAMAAPGEVKVANGQAVLPFGPLVKGEASGDHEGEAREVFEQCGFLVLRVRDLGVVLDPGQQWYRLEEAAKYLRCSVTSIYELIKDGRLSKARNGDPLFSRAALDKVAAEGVGKKKKAKKIQLAKAA